LNGRPNVTVASEADRSLSSALIGGAFGFVGIAIFASASYADKVSSAALWWGNIFSTSSVLLLVVSIYFGGKGWTAKSKFGQNSSFNKQAILGIIGIAALAISSAIFAFNPKNDETNEKIEMLSQRISTLERLKKQDSLDQSKPIFPGSAQKSNSSLDRQDEKTGKQ
jgi:hypothetical protein